MLSSLFSFFPSDFPRRHVGLKLFDSLSICFTVDLRWMVGKPAIALQQQDFHSILQWQLLTSQHRASCNTHCHPKRRGWLTIREQKCFLMWSKPLVITSYIGWKTWEEDLVYYLTKSDHTVSLLHQHWTFWVCEGLLYYPGHARLSSRPPAGKI